MDMIWKGQLDIGAGTLMLLEDRFYPLAKQIRPM
jgi:hypothetical protein